MIEDKTLRDLFRTEAEEHLQHLDDALLGLEKKPGDQTLVEEAFRNAHSLKGAARMLGLHGIQAIAHRLEDGLNAARRGAQALNPELIGRMSSGLGEVRARVKEAVGDGTSDDIHTGEATAIAPGSAKVVAEDSAARPSAFTQDAGTEPPQSSPAPSAPFRIESVRVEPKKLDALMTQAGELTVTKTRAARRLADIDALIDFCEEWEREEGARQARLGSGIRRGETRRQDAPRPSPALLERLGRVKGQLGQLRAGCGEDSARLEAIAGELESGIRLIRLLPLSTVFRLFPRMVHDIAQEHGKEVELVLEGEDTNADKRILEEMKDPLMHMLRNAVHHGIEAPEVREQMGKPRIGQVRITASQTANSVLIDLSDDGRGLDTGAIGRAAVKRGLASEETLAAMAPAQIHSLIFASGLSTAGFVTNVSGRGVGLDVVRANVERLKGSIQVDSSPGRGMSIRIRLPVTLATVRVLIVQANGHPYGLPAESVLGSRMVASKDIFTVEGRQTVSLGGRPVSIAGLAELLELPRAMQPAKERDAQDASPCVLLSLEDEIFGVLVDELLDEQEVILKPQSALLRRVRNVAGATILDSGEICMVVNIQDLLASMRTHAAAAAPPKETEALAQKKLVLLVEDSITTRTQEARILEAAGYDVVTAADGLEAYNKLATRPFDAVVTDITMPNMDGLALAQKIRGEAKYAELPIILVTALASDEDKRRGLDAGANAYITKPEFDQQMLLDCLERLI
ncbi:MAG: hybrid sensor histidine kinase/response regulator [Betaproteobacteria bacterium]|nr:hybrid sensor histidine kinase/response regulator [Betaproteobacteria bacterium]